MKPIVMISKLSNRFGSSLPKRKGEKGRRGWCYSSTKDYYRLADKIVRKISKYYPILKKRKLADKTIQIVCASHLLRKQEEMNIFWKKLEDRQKVFLLIMLEDRLELPLPSNIDRSEFVNFKRRSLEECLLSKGF